jgi:hypothetical protein
MAPTRSRAPGIRPSVSGNSQLASRRGPSSVIPTMSSPSPSPPITARSCPVPVIDQLSSGTLWGTASIPSPTRDTQNGYLAFASAPTLRTPLSSALAGISSLRYALSRVFQTLIPKDVLHSFMYLLLQSPSWGHETNLTICPDGNYKFRSCLCGPKRVDRSGL